MILCVTNIIVVTNLIRRNCKNYTQEVGRVRIHINGANNVQRKLLKVRQIVFLASIY